MDHAKRRGRGSLEYEYQRVYKACIPCAQRKVKCEASDNVRCRRCTNKNINCTFTSKKPWSRGQRHSALTPAQENTGGNESNKCVCLQSERRVELTWIGHGELPEELKKKKKKKTPTLSASILYKLWRR